MLGLVAYETEAGRSPVQEYLGSFTVSPERNSFFSMHSRRRVARFPPENSSWQSGV
jgi:hypothetical protein